MITDQKTIDGLKELNYTQVYEQGKQDARKEILEKIDILYKDFVSRCDESLPEVVNAQLQGVLMGISMVKTDIAKLNSQDKKDDT